LLARKLAATSPVAATPVETQPAEAAPVRMPAALEPTAPPYLKQAA
jgi:hypothetical protein